MAHSAPRHAPATVLLFRLEHAGPAPPSRSAAVSPAVEAWIEALQFRAASVTSADELMAFALRGRPRAVLFDARAPDAATSAAVLDACARLKRDSYTGIIPAVVFCGPEHAQVAKAFECGADEVVRDGTPDAEGRHRLDLLLRRSDRDTFVHPSTRLPGTDEIEAEINRRMQSGTTYAVCYADLDHFKEFNDRYSYYDGDRVIRILAKILHDVVKGFCGELGFVGHIGGDDFIFIVPAVAVPDTCGEIVSIFDTIVPYQYSEQDRRAGYFFGKDRRGQLHRVPLMTVSIGVVTNERRQFTHAAQMAELATEMKSYAKTLEGSVYTVDRRQDPVAEPPLVVPRSEIDAEAVEGKTS